jgi:hypothetical protein
LQQRLFRFLFDTDNSFRSRMVLRFLQWLELSS